MFSSYAEIKMKIFIKQGRGDSGKKDYEMKKPLEEADSQGNLCSYELRQWWQIN